MENVHPLRAYRDREKLTQLELAEKLGVERETVARWETGVRKIDDDLLPAVSEKTQIPRGELRPDLARLLGEVPQ